MKPLNKEISVYRQGFSLIELLVAMLIGIFLLAGISSSYIYSKNADNKRNQSSGLEDNGRFALEVIVDVLEKTGFTPNGNILSRQFITQAADVTQETCPVSGENSVLDVGVLRITAEGGGVQSDTIGTIFNGDVGHFMDCTGGSLPANCRMQTLPNLSEKPAAAKIYNSFFVDNATNTLNCSGSRSSTPLVIAEGVENIQFLYGIDTTGDGTNSATQYVKANNVVEWDKVVSIQVAILVRSLKPVKNVSVSKQYKLLDTLIISPNDKFQREVFSTTVRLRNPI